MNEHIQLNPDSPKGRRASELARALLTAELNREHDEVLWHQILSETVTACANDFELHAHVMTWLALVAGTMMSWLAQERGEETEDIMKALAAAMEEGGWGPRSS